MEDASPTVHDVAAYVLSRFQRPLSTMKLQRLVGLAQGWHLALTGDELFGEGLEAWPLGPVSRDLLDVYGSNSDVYGSGFSVSEWAVGDAAALSETQRLVVESVVHQYGALTGPEISSLPHMKRAPWRHHESCELDVTGPGCPTIPKTLLRDYFARVLDTSDCSTRRAVGTRAVPAA